MKTISAPGEILAAALAKEKAAYRFYERLETQCRINYVRDLLIRLKDEEGKHVRMIERMLFDMSSGRG
jgi:rubrerythrin